MSSYNQGQYYAQQYAAPVTRTRRTIRRVGAWSAFKVGAVVSGLIWLVIGAFFLVFALCGVLGSFGALGSNMGNQSVPRNLALGGTTALIVYVVGIILYAIIGGIVGALYALLYNATAWITGGIEVEVV